MIILVVANPLVYSSFSTIVSLKWIWSLEILVFWRDSLFALLQLINSSCLPLTLPPSKKEKIDTISWTETRLSF